MRVMNGDLGSRGGDKRSGRRGGRDAANAHRGLISSSNAYLEVKTVARDPRNFLPSTKLFSVFFEPAQTHKRANVTMQKGRQTRRFTLFFRPRAADDKQRRNVKLKGK